MSLKPRKRSLGEKLKLVDHLGLTFGGVIAIFATVIILLIAVVGFIGYEIDRTNCSQQGQELGVGSHYRLISGCWLDLPNGESIPSDQWRIYQRGHVAQKKS